MKLGIGIPYYKNSQECEIAFKKLMKTLEKQIGGNIYLYIYEDGQYSDWLKPYLFGNIKNIYCDYELKNKGIAYARNHLMNIFTYTSSLVEDDKIDYIMFLDSDDMVDCDFISKMYEAAATGKYDMIISRFIMNKKEMFYPKRCNVAGICLRTEFIKDLKFNEEYNISEDTLFINKVYERDPKIFTIDSNYYYNYGINPNSLMKRFERSEIKLKKEE